MSGNPVLAERRMNYANKCAIYGDRTEWIRRADEALAEYLIDRRIKRGGFLWQACRNINVLAVAVR